MKPGRKAALSNQNLSPELAEVGANQRRQSVAHHKIQKCLVPLNKHKLIKENFAQCNGSAPASTHCHLFLGRPRFLLPRGLYLRACFGSLVLSISFLMTSFLILSNLVYPLTLLKKRISAASRPVKSRFVINHVSLPYSNAGLATTV